MKLFFYLTLIFQIFGEVNPWKLSIFERIINRKHISHLVMENTKDDYRVTLLTHDRYPYSHKSNNYFFYIKFSNPTEAREVSIKIDKHLREGKEIRILLNGNEIRKYDLLKLD